MAMVFKKQIENILALADIRINGSRSWDIKVHDERLYRRIVAEGSLGLGEAYMDGWWDCDRLDEFFHRILREELQKRIRINAKMIFQGLYTIFLNRQTKDRAREVGEKHYDIGNDIYRAMLDQRLVYTCGYWKDAYTLDQAQEAKLDLVCRKLDLKPGQRVLDIGCGWGSFAKYAAEKYGVSVVGVTISREQVELGKNLCAGLPIEIRLQDYRDVDEIFDHIVSLGMFEHVGRKNYRAYMEVAARCLNDDGLFLLHTIGGNTSANTPDAWIDKYIFPNGMIPSVRQIGNAIEGVFVVEDWHNFGADYDKTLMAWQRNFSDHWDAVRVNYDERFYRMWNYYLLSCAGSFRARHNQLWQIVLSKNGVSGGYHSVR